MYLTTRRADIQCVVSLLPRFMHCASEMHSKAAKRIRYIERTVDYAVKFEKCQNFKFCGFPNSTSGTVLALVKVFSHGVRSSSTL